MLHHGPIDYFLRHERDWFLSSRIVPVVAWPVDAPLTELARAQDALRMMLDGLYLHYAFAIARGRTDDWAKAGHSIIDLMATQHRVPTTH